MASTKKAYDNVALHKIIKKFHQDLIEQMVEKLKAMNELFKLKEGAKIGLQVDATITTIHKGTLSILRPKVEYLQAWLRMMIDEELLKVTPHPNQVLLWRINKIYHLKYLAISLGIKEKNLKVELAFIDLYFDNMAKLKMPPIWDQPNIPMATNIWVENNHNYFDNRVKVDVSRQAMRYILKLKKVAKDAMSRFMSLGWLVDLLIVFRSDIDKLKACPVMS